MSRRRRTAIGAFPPVEDSEPSSEEEEENDADNINDRIGEMENGSSPPLKEKLNHFNPQMSGRRRMAIGVNPFSSQATDTNSEEQELNHTDVIINGTRKMGTDSSPRSEEMDTNLDEQEMNHTNASMTLKRKMPVGSVPTEDPIQEEEELEDEEYEEEEGKNEKDGNDHGQATFVLTPEILRNLTMLHEQSLEYGDARFTEEDRTPSKTDLSRFNYLDVINQELRSTSFWRDVGAEAVATFFLVSVQCCVPLTWGHPRVYGGRMHGNLAMGFVVVILIEIFGPFGGAHMNPAVSIAMVVAGRMTFIRATFYIPSQCIGGIAGAFFTYYITPPKYRENLSATQVHPGLDAHQGLMAEIWATTLLSLTIFGSTNAIRRPVFMSSLIIGCAVFVCSSLDEFSGSSMNPARSLGPAVVMNVWKDHWIYWLGPILGCLTGCLVYLHVLDRIGRLPPPPPPPTAAELEAGAVPLPPPRKKKSGLKPDHTLVGPDETALDTKRVRKPSIGLQTFSTYM